MLENATMFLEDYPMIMISNATFEIVFYILDQIYITYMYIGPCHRY